ncbi:1873_t:CDS:2, partial [Paraglomus brasilianum]
MHLSAECLEDLRYVAFWEQSEEPSLKSFLNFRLHAQDLEDKATEHNRYKNKLKAIKKYYDKTSDVRQKNDKKSKQTNHFWDLQERQNISAEIKQRGVLLQKEVTKKIKNRVTGHKRAREDKPPNPLKKRNLSIKKNGPIKLSKEHRQKIEQTYNDMNRERMWKLSTEKYVEEELFKLGQKLNFE